MALLQDAGTAGLAQGSEKWQVAWPQGNGSRGMGPGAGSGPGSRSRRPGQVKRQDPGCGGPGPGSRKRALGAGTRSGPWRRNSRGRGRGGFKAAGPLGAAHQVGCKEAGPWGGSRVAFNAVGFLGRVQEAVRWGWRRRGGCKEVEPVGAREWGQGSGPVEAGPLDAAQPHGGSRGGGGGGRGPSSTPQRVGLRKAGPSGKGAGLRGWDSERSGAGSRTGQRKGGRPKRMLGVGVPVRFVGVVEGASGVVGGGGRLWAPVPLWGLFGLVAVG